MRPLNNLPKFIWGKAIFGYLGSGFDDSEYLTHAGFPMFICRIVPYHDFLEEGNTDGRIIVWREGLKGTPVWKTNFGFLARDFFWINWPKNEEEIAQVLREACLDRRLREELYETLD
ncbi:hypothetical protein [Leptospirillum ferrooxidans]|uniref:Uncharacterized protein n=1 Tax=Leptospirillum ferrooxidans (strain C2-3) TaxID=1162668 RepID=I0IM16_LEPFC|nr:hypothetical protein [Leptospirillum ferrooxidans]BAM06315.1 hypothetical protein LFE_0599 [Leptospirillum ferrooxidans C2-3]